jgi:hypothetical protein
MNKQFRREEHECPITHEENGNIGNNLVRARLNKN